MIARRQLLARAAALAGAALLPGAWTPAVAATRLADFPFTLGVASGEPTPDGLVLCTRLAPRPLEADGDVTYRAVESALIPHSPAFDLAKFHVEAGRAGLHAV